MMAFRGGLAAAACLLLCACVNVRITRGQPLPGALTTVAVLEFESQDQSHAAGAADGCSEGVLEAGYRAVERQRVNQVLQEREQSRGGEVGAEFYRQLGEMLGVDGFIVGSVQQGGFGAPGNVIARLISAQTGDVVLMATLGSGGGGPTAGDKGRTTCRELLGAL